MDVMDRSSTQWIITNNTDGIDMEQMCLGLDPKRPSIPNDVAEYIHSNRGLHIQIRHNKDAQTFAQANDLASLICNAPIVLAALEQLFNSIVNEYKEQGRLSVDELAKIGEVILKAKGGA
jgi:hypothetical protein